MENTENGGLVIPSEIQRELPEMVLKSLADMDPQSQKIFIDEYLRRRTATDTAYILWFLGFHYAYYKKWTLLVLFWVSCFLVIGLIWWIVDIFRIKDMNQDFNSQTAIEVMKDYKSMNKD
jgi:hypothetical protein